MNKFLFRLDGTSLIKSNLLRLIVNFNTFSKVKFWLKFVCM